MHAVFVEPHSKWNQHILYILYRCCIHHITYGILVMKCIAKGAYFYIQQCCLSHLLVKSTKLLNDLFNLVLFYLKLCNIFLKLTNMQTPILTMIYSHFIFKLCTWFSLVKQTYELGRSLSSLQRKYYVQSSHTSIVMFCIKYLFQ